MVDGILGTWINFHKTVIPNVLFYCTEAFLCCIIFTSRAVSWWAEDDTTLIQALSVPFLLYPFFSHSSFLLAICFRILQTVIHKIPVMIFLNKKRLNWADVLDLHYPLSLSLSLSFCLCLPVWSFVAGIRFVSSSHLCVIISMSFLFSHSSVAAWKCSTCGESSLQSTSNPRGVDQPRLWPYRSCLHTDLLTDVG